ncbi:MAG: MFS transporter [Alphaproteobacteria bacterium]|nr:MFS transporter [Alphaproteobacteria bacterium]
MPKTDDATRAMRLVMGDGVASQIMATLTSGPLLIGLALALGASNMTIGLLCAAPFLGQLLQLPAIPLVERLRRRRLVTVVAAAANRVALLVAAATPLLPPSLALPVLCGAVLAHASLGALAACGWNSWMRDLLPPERLGRFFADRLFLTTLAGAAVSYVAGRVIDAGHGAQPYVWLFAAGVACGTVAVALLAVTPEPRMPPARERRSLRGLYAEPFRDANFRRLMAFLAAWSFSVNLAVPFFTVMMLKRLGLDMAEVVLLGIVSQVAHLCVLRFWGRLSDRFSNKAVLGLCAPLFLVCLFGWTFVTFPDRHALSVPLLFVLHAAMGVALAGATLAAGNIGLKLSPEGRATPFLAMGGVVSSMAAALAALLGGALAHVFETREMALTLRWSSPGGGFALDAVHLGHWDFFFLFACAVGLYALHRLRMVTESGDVAGLEIIRRAWRSCVLVVRPRRLAPLPRQDAPERRHVGALAALGEEGGGLHGG